MNIRFCLGLSAACLLPAVSVAEVAEMHSLAGIVRDAAGTPAAHVTIFVTEQATGVPVFGDGVPLTQGMANQRTDLLITTSVEDGTFEVTAPAGKYRLVAQRWRPPTKPWTSSMGEFDGLPHFGMTVELLGVAADVVVPSEAALEIELSHPGNGSVTVLTNPESGGDDALFVISTHAPPLDPIFAFNAWQDPILPNAIGMNRMSAGRTTFHNVPAGELHLVAFANDNSPGFGAATVTVPEVGAVEVVIDLVAGWSDGHKKPGARLLPLYEKVVDQGWNLLALDPIQSVQARINEGDGLLEALKAIEKDAVEVELPDGSKAPLRDAWAVGLYTQRWKPGAE